MTTFLLMRHGACDPIGRYLAGRSPGVRLNTEGVRQAKRLAEWLAPLAPDAIYSSPLERTLETVAPLAASLGLDVCQVPALIELDFGEWTGKTFVELEQDPRWTQFRTRRSATRIPGGEIIGEVQDRAVAALRVIQSAHPSGRVVVCSHGDVLRSIVCWGLNVGLDDLLRFDVSPASVTTLELNERAPKFGVLNWRGPSPL